MFRHSNYVWQSCAVFSAFPCASTSGSRPHLWRSRMRPAVHVIWMPGRQSDFLTSNISWTISHINDALTNGKHAHATETRVEILLPPPQRLSTYVLLPFQHVASVVSWSSSCAALILKLSVNNAADVEPVDNPSLASLSRVQGRIHATKSSRRYSKLEGNDSLEDLAWFSNTIFIWNTSCAPHSVFVDHGDTQAVACILVF